MDAGVRSRINTKVSKKIDTRFMDFEILM